MRAGERRIYIRRIGPTAKLKEEELEAHRRSLLIPLNPIDLVRGKTLTEPFGLRDPVRALPCPMNVTLTHLAGRRVPRERPLPLPRPLPAIKKLLRATSTRTSLPSNKRKSSSSASDLLPLSTNETNLLASLEYLQTPSGRCDPPSRGCVASGKRCVTGHESYRALS